MRCHLLAWAVIGLWTATAVGQTRPAEPYVWKSVTIGGNGFINGVVFGQAPGGPCYINTDMGGAYRLDGDTWTPLTDWVAHDDWSLNQNGVETLAVDPTDPDRVYLGLGTYMGPSAVLRSRDRGRTWRRTNVDFPMNGNGTARNSGQRLNVDPNLPGRLLYGTRTKGLQESRDGAATWARVSSFPAVGDTEKPLKDTGLVWTLFDARSGTPGSATPVAYVGVCTVSPGKVFRTLDAGATWQPVPNQPAGRLLPTRAALTPDGRTLFATFVTAKQYPGPWGVDGGAVYRCDDPGGPNPVWTDITPKTPPCGWSGISLDPSSPTTLYVTTLNLHAKPGDDLYRSRDGGRTWSPLNARQHRDDTGYPYVTDAGLHWLGDVQLNPHNPDEAFFTTGYGLYRTTDLRADAPTWRFFNHGFEQSAVLELVSPVSGSAHLISAIGDRDGYRHEDFAASPKYGRLGQTNGFGQQASLSMGTCRDLDVAANDPSLLVRVGAGAQWSADGGVTWQTFPGESPRNGFAEGRTGAKGPSDGHVAVAADGRSAVWTPARQPALVAARDGKGFAAWQPVQGLPAGETLVAADPQQPSTFYAVAGEATFVSTDSGRTFVRRPGTGPAKPLWLRTTPGHAGHLWLTAGEDGVGGLWRSTDGGHAWARVAADRVTVAKQVGVGAPQTGDAYPAVFIGGTVDGVRGFFRSDDAGRTWVRVNDDRHQYGNVTVIAGDRRVWGRLYVGTNGRGILYGEPASR